MFLPAAVRELADADGGQLQRRLLGRPRLPGELPQELRRGLAPVRRALRAKGWDDTLFQCFFNGKNNFKERGWSRGTCPWLLDEPSNFQDYWALRYFGAALHEGVNQAPPGKAKLAFRCDISRPQWQRDALDGLLDYNVVGGAMRQYQRIVMDRKEAERRDRGRVRRQQRRRGREHAAGRLVPRRLDARRRRRAAVADGRQRRFVEEGRRAVAVLPRPRREGRAGPVDPAQGVPARTTGRGISDAAGQVKGEPRWAVGERVREALHLSGERKGSGLPAARTRASSHFARLKPQDVWALRVRVGEALSEAAPPAKRRLIDLRHAAARPGPPAARLRLRRRSAGRRRRRLRPRRNRARARSCKGATPCATP